MISLDPPLAAPRSVRTFHPRRGRLSGERIEALSRLSPRFGLTITGPGQAGSLDPAALFGRTAPVVLEIGSGMGEATAAMAAADPDRDYLAVDVHTPGLAHLLTQVEARGLDNVRVARGDALELLESLAPDALDAIHVFFPDPWPKARHQKRRLIQPRHLGALASRLRGGGVLHCATDWADYAEQMLAALSAEPAFVNDFEGYAPRPAYRPETRFERRGLDAGRTVFDLVYRRVER